MSNRYEIASETPRKKFTPEEDARLRELVKQIGAKKWLDIAKSMPGRTGRQCRDRFQNYLSPKLTNGPWSKDDDLQLLRKVKEFGSSWSKIIQFFPGRSTNNVKNRYNIHLAKYNLDVEKFLATQQPQNQNKDPEVPKKAETVSPASADPIVDRTVWDFFKYEQNSYEMNDEAFAGIELFANPSTDVFSSWI